MSSVGDHLRGLREQRGLSLDEIARITRVASRYLEALEANRFSALPAPVFTRGFIRAYCQALGQSPDVALAQYDGRDGTAPARPAPAPAPPPHAKETEGRSPSAVMVSLVLLIVLGMALVAVALMTQPAREERRAAPAEPLRPMPPAATPPVTPPVVGAPSVAAAPAPPAGITTPSPTAPVAPATPATPPSERVAVATPPPPQSAPAQPAAPLATAQTPAPAPLPDIQAATSGLSSPYRLVARVSEATWIRVRMEDGASTEETVPAGAVREWVSNRPFVLTVGNAGGVLLELNGRTLPPLGAKGSVISRLVLPPQ